MPEEIYLFTKMSIVRIDMTRLQPLASEQHPAAGVFESEPCLPICPQDYKYSYLFSMSALLPPKRKSTTDTTPTKLALA